VKADRSITGGFTLVELVMVIVILGLLAAAALPRFADLNDQARQAGFDGVRANFKTAIAIAHARAIAQGMDATGFRDVRLDGVCINIKPGSGLPTVGQAPGLCTATARLAPDLQGWIHRLAQLPALLGVQTARAMPPPPPPPPAPSLPELLIQLDLTDWTWTPTPPTGTLTSVGGRSFVYNENDGSVQ